MDTENKQTEMRNWTTVYENLRESGGGWFKLESNTNYKVTFHDEGGPIYDHEYEGKTMTRIDLDVTVSGGDYHNEKLTWTVNLGGKESLYGMLAAVFADNGQATGLTLDVSCVGDGRNRRYVVEQFKMLKNTGRVV